jgi:hypothetical protein
MKGKVTGAAAVTGFVILAAAGALAQGFYNYAIPGGFDDFTFAPFGPSYGSYSRFYTSPGGGLYSGSVNMFSADLGSGVSMDLVTSGPAAGFSGLSGSALLPGFPSALTPNYANGLYLNPAMSTPFATSGRVSVSLGRGLSWDVIGGVSRIPGNGFYYGPGGRFGEQTFTTVGTGFSFNFRGGGTLSLSGSVTSASGSRFP